jgi:hypothetical protein
MAPGGTLISITRRASSGKGIATLSGQQVDQPAIGKVLGQLFDGNLVHDNSVRDAAVGFARPAGLVTRRRQPQLEALLFGRKANQRVSLGSPARRLAFRPIENVKLLPVQRGVGLRVDDHTQRAVAYRSVELLYTKILKPRSNAFHTGS